MPPETRPSGCGPWPRAGGPLGGPGRGSRRGLGANAATSCLLDRSSRPSPSLAGTGALPGEIVPGGRSPSAPGGRGRRRLPKVMCPGKLLGLSLSGICNSLRERAGPSSGVSGPCASREQRGCDFATLPLHSCPVFSAPARSRDASQGPHICPSAP